MTENTDKPLQNSTSSSPSPTGGPDTIKEHYLNKKVKGIKEVIENWKNSGVVDLTENANPYV
ncbi:hypothetical protein M1146_07370 [Patescibacteria group bacterium]|nr:hypothetical protein [Patescibacteria group bacterium]